MAHLLDIDQRRAYDHITDQVREYHGQQQYHYITGYPGTGKSYLTRSLINDLEADHTVVTLSWYGLAARNLRAEASTIMAYFGLTFSNSGQVADNSYLRCTDVTMARMIEYLRAHGSEIIRSPKLVIVIDEIGALHNTLLDAMAGAVRELRRPKLMKMGDSVEKPFGDAAVLMIGDPCQTGRMELTSTSAEYPPAVYPTKEFWLADSWKAMRPNVYFLRNIHRGGDQGYLGLLREIRAAPRIRPGLPRFSPEAMEVLQSIRDRDGGERPPRYDHVVVCFTNAEVDRHNEQYLRRLPGEVYELDAVDSGGPTNSSTTPFTPSKDFLKSVSRLGYRERVNLKVNCRVMATVNSTGRTGKAAFYNGMMGKVLRIYRNLNEEPVVVVKFDDVEDPVHVERETLTIRNKDGSIRFERRQTPLVPCYAATGHKLIGTNLAGLWVHLPNRHGRVDSSIQDYWLSSWLEGVVYTVLSRIGERQNVKVFPIRRTDEPALLHPIFSMSSAALAFDAECAERDWLTLNKSEEAPENRAPTTAAAQQIGISESLNQSLEQVTGAVLELAGEVRSLKSKSMVTQHYTTKRRTSVSGDPINPVFFCAQRPDLEQKIDSLPTSVQVQFYDMLDERLNLTHVRPTHEQVQQLLTDVINQARAPDTPTPPDGKVSPEAHDGSLASLSTPRDLHGQAGGRQSPAAEADPSEDPADAADVESLSRDEDFLPEDLDPDSDSDVSQESPGGPTEIPPRYDDPPAGEVGYGDEPFTVFEGGIYDVVSEYLKCKPHYRLVNGCIEELKTKRKTCYLECRRSVSTRNDGREASRGSRPDWRLWPAFTCKLRRIKVQQNGSLCHMYPLGGVEATNEEWRNHSHFPGTEECRSARIPPDILDDWQMWLAEQPCIPTAQLKAKSRQKCIDGQYSASTIEFITQKGLENYELVRSALRSIKKSKECGLSVEAFTRELSGLACGADELRSQIAGIIRSIDAVETGTHSEEDLTRARDADRCIVLEDILCSPQPAERGSARRSVRAFSAVVTSPRMLRNMRSLQTVGVDATFNLTHADLVLGTICSVPRTSTALPIALIVMTKESTECVEHGLKQLTAAAEALGFYDAVPREVVMDGSDAIHSAVMSQYAVDGRQPRCISCFFHVIKRAKECKGKARLGRALWGELRKDLRLMGGATTRAEWLSLREAFMTKWTSGRPQDLGPSDRAAIQTFLTEFNGYLDISAWRSWWGSYSSEVCGARTNNCVERFNKELKKHFLPARCRLSLHEFVTFLKSGGDWSGVSQYGREAVRGQAKPTARQKAVDHFLNESYCQIPRSWYPPENRPSSNQWLFLTAANDPVTNGTPLRDFIHERDGVDAKKMCLGTFDTMAQAHSLKKQYCIVTYTESANPNEPPPIGPSCSCSAWLRDVVCCHTLCLGHVLGQDHSEEAAKAWKTARCFFTKARRRRDGQRRFGDEALPSSARYGLNEPQARKRGREEGNEAPETEDRQPTVLAYSEVRWPSYPFADGTTYCGCRQGYSSSVDMLECSNPKCDIGWWHTPCIETYAAASGLTSSHLAAMGTEKKWYCFGCRRKRRGSKRRQC